MWTPKRIILLAVCFVAFTLVYILYSLTALGRINTLPPLPEQYQPSNDPDEKMVRARQVIMPTLLERKLEMAFHPGCEELTWPVRLELPAKNMLIAAWKFELADHGRVRLELMSLALFGKKKNDGREIEINTLKCKQAYITFDQPITGLTPGALKDRKITEAELFGDGKMPITITNNRRTSSREDDLVVRIDSGPLYYKEDKQLVTTIDHVNLTDGSPISKDGRLIPPKAVIDAVGMDMELETTAPPPRPGVHIVAHPANKQKNDTITGVKRIVLKEAVRMNLVVSGGTPFPSSDKTSGGRKPPVPEKNKAPTPPARQEAPNSGEPAIVQIVTPGRFEYELFKDHDMARFDVPANTMLANSPQDVTVTRINQQDGKQMFDMLVCKHLELRLKRRNNDTPAPREAAPSAPEEGLQIETVYATGPDVTLTSDAEKLDAHGNDFFHDAAKKLTILKGVPFMEANKEDSLIQAPELRIQDIPLPDETGGPPLRQAATPPAGGTGVPPVSAAAPVAVGKGTEKALKTFQQIEASGPGSIHMMNKSTGKQNVHAYWKERLLSTREGTLDKLVLTGAARFVDDEHEQWLQAEELEVWLLPEENKAQAVAVKPAAPAAKSQAAAPTSMPGSSRKPHRVVALRNVLAHSLELNIHDAARLVIHFRDVPVELMPPPSSSNNKPDTTPNKPGTAAADKKPNIADPPPELRGPKSEVKKDEKRDGVAPAQPAAPPAAPTEPRPGSGNADRSLTVAAPNQQSPQPRPGPDPARPIDLSARSIEAKVLRCSERMALDHLWAEGGSLDAIDKHPCVKVRQEPAKSGEGGVYIEGNTLDMTCHAAGNVLVVTGDLAQLKMDKILILGPEVNIDQVENKAYVIGEGAMQMQSATTLEGKPLTRPVPLIVHWGDNMLFKGTFAFFVGNIQAEQDNARLACQQLQVYFDRPISLKEGMRGTQPAKVSSLVADKGAGPQPVHVEEQTFEGTRLQKYQLLIGRELHMTSIPRDEPPPVSPPGKVEDKGGGKSNDANKVALYGPGSVCILQRGDSDLTIAPGGPAPNQPAAKKDAKDQVMKLTYVSFMKQMQANSLTNVATFWESVRVLNFPCGDPHCNIDLDDILSKELPEGTLYLRCNILKVSTYQKTVGGGTEPKQVRTYQVMDAQGQVYVQGRDFTAQCDRMTFNEEKDQVIFVGQGDNLAVMTKGDFKGIERKSLKGKKIKYIRSTGDMSLEEIGSIDG